MAPSFSNYHFVWPLGYLCIFKDFADLPTACRWRTAQINTPIFGPGNSERNVSWSMLLGKDSGMLKVGLNLPKNDASPPMHVCVRSVLRSPEHSVEKSLYFNTSTIDTTPSVEFWPTITRDVIIQQIFTFDTDSIQNEDYVLHVWIDVAVGGDAQCAGKCAFKEKALVQYTREAARPDMFADSETVPLYSDLVVRSGERRYHVHRFVLAALSPVFDTMLSAEPWNEQGEREIVVEDVDASSFKNLLYYCYTEMLPADFNSRPTEEIFNLVYAADKYNIRGLKEELESLLLRLDCTDEERLEQLCVAYKHNLPTVKEICELILSTKLGIFADNGLPLSESFAEKVSRKMELPQIQAICYPLLASDRYVEYRYAY